MQDYKTPGVYVEEISTLGPSIAEVETAIPAFMGFTEKGPLNDPRRISSLLDYQLAFGGADPEKNIVVNIQGDIITPTLDLQKRSKSILFYAMQLYFQNGGGPCYIVSIGLYADSGKASLDLYNAGLAAISKEDEPTILAFPDAGYYLQKDYYSLMNSALMQCEDLGDRFAIIDVLCPDGDLIAAKKLFRDNISNDTDNLKYGAAYYPSLKTTINYVVDEDSITVNGLVDVAAPVPEPVPGPDEPGPRPRPRPAPPALSRKFSTLQNQNGLKNQIRQKLRELGVELTPCAAVAGVYAHIDSFRGVWKAPANVSLKYVSAPIVKITDDDQKDLNVDVNAGKSINAIRSFAGKGTIVWGARTLAGNDNEWRYVSVRRFFNMVEESVRKSTNWAVFEPNDSGTWVKVRAMIENYLISKWRQGALAGAKAEDAFYVRLGLGQTMSPQDILEGRMIVEIGMAAVRPAEFIVLQFAHKLQTS